MAKPKLPLTLLYFITSDDQVVRKGEPSLSWKDIQIRVPAFSVPEVGSQIRFEKIDKTGDVRAHERHWDAPDTVTIFLDIQGGFSEFDVATLEACGWETTPND